MRPSIHPPKTSGSDQTKTVLPQAGSPYRPAGGARHTHARHHTTNGGDNNTWPTHPLSGAEIGLSMPRLTSSFPKFRPGSRPASGLGLGLAASAYPRTAPPWTPGSVPAFAPCEIEFVRTLWRWSRRPGVVRTDGSGISDKLGAIIARKGRNPHGNGAHTTVAPPAEQKQNPSNGCVLAAAIMRGELPLLA